MVTRDIHIEEFTHNIAGIVLVARRWTGCTRATWYLQCKMCGNRHVFKKLGSALWHTSCEDYKIEWTITPKEYHETKVADFTRILGDV